TFQEFFQVGRQIVQADAVNGGHADGAGNDVFDLLQLAEERIVSLDDLLAVIVKNLALAGEPELFLAPLDQQRLELAFERTDLLADRRLGHVIDLGGLGETFGFGEVAEDLQAFDLHGNPARAVLPGGPNANSTWPECSRKINDTALISG